MQIQKTTETRDLFIVKGEGEEAVFEYKNKIIQSIRYTSNSGQYTLKLDGSVALFLKDAEAEINKKYNG